MIGFFKKKILERRNTDKEAQLLREENKKVELKMGSDEVHNQSINPTCASHATASAIRGVLRWKKKEGFVGRIPSFQEVQVGVNAIRGETKDNNEEMEKINSALRSEDSTSTIKRLGIVCDMFATPNVLGVLENAEKTGAHLTMTLFLCDEGWESFRKLKNTDDVVYYPKDKILFPFFETLRGTISKPGHMMFVSGWGIDNNGVAFVELKNSWGKNWGNDGKIKMSVLYFTEHQQPILQAMNGHIEHYNTMYYMRSYMGLWITFTAYVPEVRSTPLQEGHAYFLQPPQPLMDAPVGSARGNTAYQEIMRRRVEGHRHVELHDGNVIKKIPPPPKGKTRVEEHGTQTNVSGELMNAVGGGKNRSAKHNRKIRSKRKRKKIRKRTKRKRKKKN